MKRLSKILIKKDNQIKAILDIDGKILTDDKRLKKEIEFIVKQDLVVQSVKKGSHVSSLTKVSNEVQLYTLLRQELELEGYDVE